MGSDATEEHGMSATAGQYDSPFISEVVKEVDGTYDDCAVASTLMLAYDATLGEIGVKADGTVRDVLAFREAARKVLGPDKASGGLKLSDTAKMLHELDPDFHLDYYPGHGGTLRLTFEEWKAAISSGSVSVLLGNPSGIKDPSNPLCTVQNNPDYAHAIWVGHGNEVGAIVKDPLKRKLAGYNGQRVAWPALRQFTEASKGGDRLFGSDAAIAVAVALIGSETQAARTERAEATTAKKLRDAVAAQKAQTALHADERDQARRDLATAQARVAELEAAGPTDCSAEVDRALTAEQKVQDALTVLTR